MRLFLIGATAITTAFLCTLLLAEPPSQLPSQIELSCPAGSQVVQPVGQTYNASTDKYRQWLCVDSFGNIVQSTGAGSPGGSNTQVQYNNNGVLTGSPNLTFSGSTLTVGQNNVTLGVLAIANQGGGLTSLFTSSGSLLSGPTGYQASGTNSVSGCALTANLGGASAGKFASGTTGTCTVTITLPTATNGWKCDAHDITTVADVINQTAFATNSATISGTTASGDVITWGCTAF